MEQIFSLDMKKIQNGSLILFKNNKFLPHFYTPQTLISTNQATAILPEIVSQNDYNIRSAIYFNNISKVSTDNKEVIKFNPDELRKDTVINTLAYLYRV